MQDAEGVDVKPPVAFSELPETKVVFWFCVLAAIHVFVFSAAFPFFNNVDEAMHFDLVLKYAHGEAPRKFDTVAADSTSYLALMNSREYFRSPEQFSSGHFPPAPWTLSADKEPRVLAIRSMFWRKQENYETSQAPLYYMLAALWWHLGEWLDFHEGGLVYWLRFLNAVQIVGLVWLGHAIARLVFPENHFVRLGVPALLALMPQSAFYSIGNDMLSSLCFGITLYFLIQWFCAEKPSVGLGAATGLAFAATYLSKSTNIPLLAVTAAAIVLKSCQDIWRGKFRGTEAALAGFFYCSEPPIIFWIIWCKRHFGDSTGSAIKANYLDWTLKPFAQWWHHPIFSPSGFWTYLSGQVGTFWQGEFWWHGVPMSLPGTDTFYTLLSIILLAAALPTLLSKLSSVTPIQRGVLWLGLACFVAELIFFAVMSTAYDFHESINPSRHHPYFEAGRMLLGALIPFLLLCVYGLYHVFNRFKIVAKWRALTFMILIMLVIEIVTNWPASVNDYNWFHLP